MKVAINGFGRIGRLVLRSIVGADDIEVVAINDLADPVALTYLFRYDSVHGRYDDPATLENGSLNLAGRSIQMTAERSPKDAWAGLDIDIVIDATGVFRKRAGFTQHLEAGARRVLLTAPSAEADRTIVFGVNEQDLDITTDFAVSNASCTTNCIAPVARVLHEAYGIATLGFTTVHAYTASQALVDVPMRKLRRGRAAALSMIPTTTGASEALGQVMPELRGRTCGTAIRVPTPDGSLTDMTLRFERPPASAEALIEHLRAAASTARMAPVLEVSDDPHVSIDIVGNPHSAIVDTDQTHQVSADTFKLMAWYDNEWGYSSRVVDLTRLMGQRLLATKGAA
ncbi:MAG: glyceraldehyde 3-phosphate dehydrogenase [Myxococcota bacterium]|jgi:glyceraldehyde 3-phosphate dehydrogenase